jgi:hypothetical protein
MGTGYVKSRTMLPPAHRTMAVIGIEQGSSDFIANLGA